VKIMCARILEVKLVDAIGAITSQDDIERSRCGERRSPYCWI